MIGGLLFKLNNKMLCGIHIDKKYDDSLLMARIGEDVYERELKKPHCLPIYFTSRPMKGYFFIMPYRFNSEDDLNYWLKLCIAFNPLSKAKEKIKVN